MNKFRKKVSFLLIVAILSLNFSFSYASDTTDAVSQEEKTKVQNEIVNLQLNILNSGKTKIQTLVDDFSKLTKYEEKGNTKLNLSFDEDTFFGSGNASLSLNNYNIKNSVFNYDMSGNIDFSGAYKPLYGSGIDFNLKAFGSIISKDNEIYALLKDLDFKINNENLSKILEKLKSEFSDNKYVKFPANKESQAFMNFIKDFDLNSSFQKAESILKEPLLTPYKKSGDKYLLVPTKYACETYFNLETQFNLGLGNSFFTPKSCSDTVYKAFLGEFVKAGDFYMILGTDSNSLGFDGKDDRSVINLLLTYNSNSVLKFDLSVVPDQNKYPNEGFSFNYEKNNYLKSNFNVNAGSSKVFFDSKLDSNNAFSEISSDFDFDKDFSGKFELKDKKIAGFFYAKERGYDYNDDDFKFVLKNVYGGKITGALNSDNSLNNLNVKLAGVGVKDKKVFLLSNLDILGKDINFTLKFDDGYSNFNVQSNGKYEKNYFKLDSIYSSDSEYYPINGKLNFEIDSKDNKNNGYINFDLNSKEKNILKFDFSNEALREYKEDLNIEAPSNYKELDPKAFEDVLYPKSNSFMYDENCPEDSFC